MELAELEERKALPMTKVVDMRRRPEESKASPFEAEPEIKTALQLGEYIFKNNQTFPQDLIKLTEQKADLIEVSLKHIRLNSQGIKHLSVVLYFFKNLQLVDFTDMQLQPRDFELLCPPLSKMADLEELVLTANNLAEASRIIGNTFQYINKLVILNLSDCYLSPENCRELAPGLGALKLLKLLQMSLNPIGDIGCKAVCESIRNMPALVELDLFTCEISDRCRDDIDLAFRGSQLYSVLLGNNKFSPKCERWIKKRFAFVHFGIKHYRCEIF